MYIVCDDEWITPIKYERDILNFPFCLFSGVTSRARILLNHVSMDEKFALQTPHIVKKFKFAYTKGHIADDGSITPFFY